ncbi:protease complex subunit PrcB family protein [Deinococcus sp. SDU3-2]|uniref:Protease complex subunit PrcB family protein n=1 Tax=Deinococcus terrestris TaxID=2651870 RepID=A0A7X1TQX1_9DEIO|nr:protease complex subunit PrcB family protein [Deinococcus terrestris]MPY65697.1 protease complex subunit PrcB family protein [Deinococcus terrestris]
MKKTMMGAALLGTGLLAGCTMTGPGSLRVHEVALYGGTQERIVWVYGALEGGRGSVKVNGTPLDLRPQISDPLALPGTLSVNGAATYRLPTSTVTPKLAVTRDTLGRFSVPVNEARGTVYFTDGRTWLRLNGASGANLTALPVSGLRGAGELTDAEADVLSRALTGQGPLAVTVLPEAEVPDPRLTVEPTPAEYRHTALYIQSGVPTLAAQPGTPAAPPTAGGRVTVTELASGTNAAQNNPAVQLATSQSALNALYRVAYGNQTGAPGVPALRTGETVVGVFLGQRPTGGYGVRVTGASVQGGTLTLTVEIRSPGAGAITTQALTSPWTLVRVPGVFQSVQLVDGSGRPVQLGGGAGGQTR